MRIVSFFCVCELLAGVCPAARASADDPGRHVIRSDELREAGVSRLGDLVFLLDDWSGATIDGFTWSMTPRGLGGDGTASFVVIVDGIPLDVDQFGSTSLNRVPVHVSDIDSIEVIDRPRIHHGEFAGRGIIHIHTRSAGDGFRIAGSAFSGNESGDPGPYAFTDLASPNVDRIGPDYSAEGEYGAGEAGARVSFLRHRHYPTDEAVRQRNFEILYPDYPQMTLAGFAGTLGGQFLGGRHRAFVARSRFDDFFFFTPYGREVPVVSELTAGGVSGSTAAGERAILEYRFAYTRSDMGYRRNTLALDFNWREERWAGDAEIHFQTRALRHLCGVGFERVSATTGYALSDDDYTLTKLYAEWFLGRPDDFSHRAGVTLLGGGDEVSFDATAAERWRMSSEHAVEVAASFAERRPERDGRIWYWDERGYGFLEDAGVGVTRDETIGTSRTWTADVDWTAEWTGVISTVVGIYYRDFSNLYLESQRFQFDPDQGSFGSPVRLLSDQDGGVAGGELVARIGPSRNVRFRAAYRHERALSGDEAFRWSRESVPRHLVRLAAWWTPCPSFTAWTQLSGMSGTEWRAYEDASSQTGGAYRSHVDAFVTLDAALVKWLWQDRVRASLLLRDLLRQTPRYHPIGAAFDTSLFVEIGLGFGSATDSRRDAY